MPQLWLTYEELADELDCGSDQARATAVHRGWTRKRSRDGLTRVLMPYDLMSAYLAGRRSGPSETDPAYADPTHAMVTALRATLAIMAPNGRNEEAKAPSEMPAPRRRLA